MLYMQERCGAWQVGTNASSGAAEFKIFYPQGFDPHVSAIEVVGSFQDQLGGVSSAMTS